MWTLLFLVLAFRTALSSIPSPTNVTFASVNLRNILQWSPAPDTPAHTKYTVRYATYGDSVKTSKANRLRWRPVPHCTEFTWTWCDLSVETSDLEHRYLAKVRAVGRKNHSKWVETQQFDPKINTEFGPPHVSVEIDDNNAIITIEGPMRYFPHNHLPQVPMAALYSGVTYNLSVNNTHSGQIRHFPLTISAAEKYRYRTTNPGTEYCFSAKTKIVFMPNKHHSSAWVCIIMPQVSVIDQLQRIVVGIIVPVVFLGLLVAGGHVLYKYLSGKDQKSPYILNRPTFFPPPLTLPPDPLNFIVILPPKVEVPSDFDKNKLYPALPRPETPHLCDLFHDNSGDYGGLLVDDNAESNENPEEVNVEKSKVDEEKQSYKSKEWQIEEAESSGGSYASQNSFLQTSSVNPMLLNPSKENRQGLSLHENPETGSLQLQFNNENESSNVVEGRNVENCSGYVSQRVCPMEPTNQSFDLPDDYGVVGVAAEEEEEEAEDVESLHVTWDPETKKLIISGLDLGLEQSEGERQLRNWETVFVRQPSEEEALLGEEGGGSGQWGAEEFMTKWDLVVSDD